MSAVDRITYDGKVSTPDGDHYTRWLFHCDDGETVVAELTAFVRHPTEPGRWRYSLLTFASGATVEHVDAPLDLWIANASAAFGTLTAAAEHAIGAT